MVESDGGRGIPPEILLMIEKGDFSLLIRGEIGTGKTLLSFSLASMFNNISYISTGAPVNEAVRKFWFKGLNVHFFDLVKELEVSEDQKSCFLKLKQFIKSFLEFSTSSVLVVDSWDGFIKVFKDIDEAPFIYWLFNQFTQNKNQNFILIKRGSDPSYLEQLFENVLTLNVSRDDDGRLYRILNIEKLDNSPLMQGQYLFTLKNGIFQICQMIHELKLKESDSTWLPVADNNEFISTGSKDLDALLGGGLRMGTFNVIEIDSLVPDEINSLFIQVILNFLHHDRGVISSVVSPDNKSKAKLLMFSSHEQIVNYLRNIARQVPPDVANKKYSISIRNRKEILFNTFNNLYDSLSSDTDYKTILSLMEYIPIEINDPEMQEKILDHITFVRSTNIIELGLIFRPNGGWPSNELSQHIQYFMDIADTHLRIAFVHNSLLMYGIRPFTGYYNVVLADESLPRIKLIEVL
ncbi:MAG: gas vesicle protein GvpD P-loop domain-containing protein [Promethearchaeota archaeon]